MSILASDTVSTAVSQDILQPAAAELVPAFDVLFDLAGSDAYRGGHFRAPPRLLQFTVLRI